MQGDKKQHPRKKAEERGHFVRRDVRVGISLQTPQGLTYGQGETLFTRLQRTEPGPMSGSCMERKCWQEKSTTSSCSASLRVLSPKGSSRFFSPQHSTAEAGESCYHSSFEDILLATLLVSHCNRIGQWCEQS